MMNGADEKPELMNILFGASSHRIQPTTLNIDEVLIWF